MNIAKPTPEDAKNWLHVIRDLGLYFVSTAALMAFVLWQFQIVSRRNEVLQDKLIESLTTVIQKNTDAFEKSTEAIRQLQNELRRQ